MTVCEKRLRKVREVLESMETRIEGELKEELNPILKNWHDEVAVDMCVSRAINTLLDLFRKWDGKR
ncbi:hypothetical protein ES703_122019 [subsurface metagenome]|jgi:uncharacterized protein YqgV (UPF0045/DUF77 family)